MATKLSQKSLIITFPSSVSAPTGTSLINKTGWTKLGVREGHDLLDVPYDGDIFTSNYVAWISSESSTNKPYLDVTYEYQVSATETENYYYLDGYNRKVQERRSAEDINVFSVKDYSYNKLGLLEKESLPYFSSSPYLSPMTATSSLWINYTYDPLQRVTTVVNSVATTTNAYDDWKVTITDGEGKAKDLYKDAYDNLIQVDEHNATSTYSTYYQYNLLGNLTKITDALTNVRNFTYDSLGRRLTAQDLHAPGDGTYGAWTYTFDDSGNLTSKLDPKSQTVNYTYDDLNRVLTENYTGSAGTEVSYGYDLCTNGKGRLCSATTTASVLNLAYNPLGLVSSERKTINSTDYTTTYSYDRQGNQTLITIPDSTEIKYEYNNGGLLEKVSKKQTDDLIYYYLLEDIDYSPLGQKTYENYANNTASYYIYDEDKLYRLEEKQTSIATSSLQDLNYTYDKVGNITKIIDSSNTNTAKTMDFTYDDLHRLTVASSTNAVSGDNFRETYSYNAIGNILNKSDIGNYTYTDNGYNNPHAATSINGTTYAYDNNGNLLSDSTWTHTWDYDNRLTQSSNGIATTTYAYDQDGNRIKKTEGGETSYYVNPYYEVDNGLKKRHILANGAPIATIEDEINTEGCMPPESGDWTISTSCQLMTSARALGDVTINANAVLTIASSSILEIDLHNHKLLVRHNGGVKIKKGSTLRQTTAQTLPVTLRSDTIYHYPDHLMGTSIDTNDQGVVLEAIDYLPFGETRIDEKTGTHENDYKFTGKELDSSTDLYYFGARYQNPSIGRFVSLDPASKDSPEKFLLDPQQFNFYSYARNNPLIFIDTDGKETVIWVKLPKSNNSVFPWAHDYGHVMININGTFYDYYPTENGLIELMFGAEAKVGKGTLSEKMDYYSKDDGAMFTTYEIDITKENEESLQAELEKLTDPKANEKYRAKGNNCVDFTRDLLNKYSDTKLDKNIDTPTELSKSLFGSNKTKEIGGGYEYDNNYYSVPYKNQSYSYYKKTIMEQKNITHSESVIKKK